MDDQNAGGPWLSRVPEGAPATSPGDTLTSPSDAILDVCFFSRPSLGAPEALGGVFQLCSKTAGRSDGPAPQRRT
jgi:hypothetical protein